MIKRKKWLTGLAIVPFIAIIAIAFDIAQSPGDIRYKTKKATRGTIEKTISSSGVLSPVTTVDIGTQVSGTIARVYADFNDKVTRGQLLAVLDTVLLKASVSEAEAGVQSSKAALLEASAEEKRNHPLFVKGLISESEYLPFKTALHREQAALKSAYASLQRARQNLAYAYITSPIHGQIITRNVEAGQTVAANFSTPTLFEIAEDLTEMEILVAVDESDIGLIREKQQVHFEVLTYEERTFEGIVKQIRLQPNTISNVVNYTVVIEAKNDSLLLLPGMTATVDFVIDASENALLVPKMALSFLPGERTLHQFNNKQQQKNRHDSPDALSHTLKDQAANAADVWFLDQKGQLQVEPVLTGLKSGKYVEIVKTRHLKPGLDIITGFVSAPQNGHVNRKKTVFQSGPPQGGPGR
jgi:HlyD family secretion protein